MKRKSGRPRTVNTRRTRAIIKKRIGRNDSISLNKIAQSLRIARSSVKSIVRNELKLRSYRLLKGHQLTYEPKMHRLKKCKESLKMFKVRRLEDVLRSDEKIFTVEVAHNPQNYRQLISPMMKNSRKRRIATKSLFPKKEMVWGGITANGKTPLVLIAKNVKINAQVYQDEFLKKVFLKLKQQNCNMIFQQDWAPAHKAKTTIAYPEANFPGYLTKDQWPAYSPDLNPLEFSAWGFLEKKLKNKKITDLNQLQRELVQA